MSLQPTIVAIGGGELGPHDTAGIDQYIIRLPGKTNPHVLFIPTASRDSAEYMGRFQHWYSSYGCTVRHLMLAHQEYTRAELESAVAESDIIYVGGGNTLFLYNYWLTMKLDEVLHAAWKQGTIIAGLSAGCNIWHTRYLTDSIAGEWRMGYGLGWLPGFVTPHYDSESERQPVFREIVKQRHLEGLALDDCTAAVYRDTQLAEIIATATHRQAYRVQLQGDTVVSTQLPKRVVG